MKNQSEIGQPRGNLRPCFQAKRRKGLKAARTSTGSGPGRLACRAGLCVLEARMKKRLDKELTLVIY
jgi:hypothetical protein